MLFGEYGQFLDHDISTLDDGDEPSDIQIPQCDSFFDPNCSGTQKFSFFRSIFDQNSQVRTQINSNTPWIDGSQVYGPDKTEADSLREFIGGRLKTSVGNLLPKDVNGQF